MRWQATRNGVRPIQRGERLRKQANRRERPVLAREAVSACLWTVNGSIAHLGRLRHEGVPYWSNLVGGVQRQIEVERDDDTGVGI